jgi:DNA-directed RNA polymerase specialized sigma24 family protein
MTFDDYKQELSMHLWRKLPLYKADGKAKIETWASKVMRLKCIDIDRVHNKEKRTQRRKEKLCRVNL